MMATTEIAKNNTERLEITIQLSRSNGRCLTKLGLRLIPTLSSTARLKFPQGSCIAIYLQQWSQLVENVDNLMEIGETDSSV